MKERSTMSMENETKELERAIEAAEDRDSALDILVETAKNKDSKYTWVGIYLLQDDRLILGPFRGKPSPHTEIHLSKGICGAAVREGETLVIDDVNADPRYLACSLETRSEIVVPIRNATGEIVAEIDVDSDRLAAFDQSDRRYFERLAQIAGQLF